MENQNTGTKLAAALVAAQQKARAVALDGKNEHHKYRYAKAEDIIDGARITLGQCGLSVFPTSWSTVVQSWTVPVPGPDGPQLVAVDVPHVEVHYLVLHESGEHMALCATTPAIEGKGRPIDKAACAALTTNLAYMLRGLLLMPRDDDAAAIDARDDRGYDPGDREPARAPTSAAPPTADDVAEQEAAAFEALIREFGRTGQLDELERVPAKIVASKLPKPIYQRLVGIFNPIVTELRARRKAESAAPKDPTSSAPKEAA